VEIVSWTIFHVFWQQHISKEVMTKQTLSKEANKRFDESFMEYAIENENNLLDPDTDVDSMKSYLAQEIQTAYLQGVEDAIKAVEEIVGDNNDVYLLPPGINKVYGYSDDEKTRVSAICVTNDFRTLTKKEK
jgi:uncharacterized protein (DUF2164 family)